MLQLRFTSPGPPKRSRLRREIEELINDVDEDSDCDEGHKELLDTTVLLQMQMVAMKLQQRQKIEHLKLIEELKQENRMLAETVREQSKKHAALLQGVILPRCNEMRRHWDSVVYETQQGLQLGGI